MNVTIGLVVEAGRNANNLVTGALIYEVPQPSEVVTRNSNSQYDRSTLSSQVVLLLAMAACLATALPAPGHYGGGGGGYGGGGHGGHGHATSFQNYVLHSYHPVKVKCGGLKLEHYRNKD